MDGIIITPLRRVVHPKGDVLHALKACEKSYTGFGEAYFTTVMSGETKGWKKHLRMTMNLVVPVGNVCFYFRQDNGKTESINLGETNYQRLTVSPGLWVAFRGLSNGLNLVLNVADLEHDPVEAVNVPLETYAL
ncbi:dTDP-4-dehydrorhamnose 3,5-epimerase [Acidithiobacillus thiooxidans]|uniref:dTDP-4-dehydrorhamnose 3,5-epimerase n=1 Tax=Acidithiobacillus thiooxidans TaxID=930 RepID=UPI001D013279|nr:dTDP-4-dehydrorhamnose 3,5-epimerase [Acidithiobacillus thiooxidans]MBU2838612.1 dTDP-4-dehydrorhamnose 3,5-epimerase [Acidithiobacillus thiooxidans]MDD2801724.1 dTDP-4-dehydrorhamnose 3,5-epimerase [Methylococcales bacterium]